MHWGEGSSMMGGQKEVPRTTCAEREMRMNLRLAAMLALLVLPAVLWAVDASTLRPPKGARVALVAFEDLQCSDCAAAEALLEEASAKYGIPLVRRDFPLPKHNWAFEAHVMARYFDTNADAKPRANSLPLGEEFRRWVYVNQSSINKENLRGMGARFADQHKIELPANYDPLGELKNKVLADYTLGQQLGVTHTPTVYVVGEGGSSAPFVESVEREKLFAAIEKMQAAEKR